MSKAYNEAYKLFAEVRMKYLTERVKNPESKLQQDSDIAEIEGLKHGLATQTEAFCSFCHESNIDVGKLVQGDTGALICKACAALAAALIDMDKFEGEKKEAEGE